MKREPREKKALFRAFFRIEIMNVDVIIPTYKPEKSFISLLSKLCEQTVKVNRVIIMNTDEELFGFTDEDLHPFEGIISLHHIKKSEFDHGNTRHLAMEMSDADICVLMTMDAMPVDNMLLERLIEPFANEKVAISYARQLAYESSSAAEKLIREFNYPDGDVVKSRIDVEKLGIKAYFCSNVCSAYRKSVYKELGGFIRKTIFNEDMIYAAKAVNSGYQIAYVSEARVYHSHDYTCMQQFRRNFDNGVSHAMNPDVFEGLSQDGEGMRMVKSVVKGLNKQGKSLFVPAFICKTGFRFVGFKLGCRYEKLPKKFVRWCSSSPNFFSFDTK